MMLNNKSKMIGRSLWTRLVSGRSKNRSNNSTLLQFETSDVVELVSERRAAALRAPVYFEGELTGSDLTWAY